MSESDSIAPVLYCPACRYALNVNRTVDQLDDECPLCRSEVSAEIFPRLYAGHGSKVPPKLAGDAESACTFFPEQAAVKVCDECGCFLSERAAVRWGGEDLCLPCLHRLREEVRSSPYVARAKLHDNRAFLLVTLLAPFSLITAPLAIFLLLRNRKGEHTFTPRSRARWWLSMILAMGWILFWAVLIVVWTSLVIEDLT